MAKKIKIIGIAGSLRKGSYNKSILEAAKKLCPQEAEVEIMDIGDIPLYNQDLDSKRPKEVTDLKKKIQEADAVLFATPEYNYSVPGVLKNAIDWISRPYGDNSFVGKPTGIMSASIGMLGGARAQYHLRQSMVFLNMHPMNTPEFMLPFAAEKIDGSGNINDEKTKEKVKEYMVSFVDWIKKFRP